MKIKILLFNILAIIFLPAHAEYYLTYSTADRFNSCTSCSKVSFHKHSAKHHRHHRFHRKTGLFVYYPVLPCCCSSPNQVRSQWGDYVVFTSRPTDHRYGLPEEGPAYNPDLSTTDDGYADLEVN